MEIEANSEIIFRQSSTLINGKRDECVKVFMYKNGVQGCHVGFLPRYLRSVWPEFFNQRGVVVKDLRFSDNGLESSRSARMGGVAMVYVRNRCF